MYDHPFLWGSKRIGPDLQRIGKKYPDAWHYNHMKDPTSMSPGSIMPRYPWLFEQSIDTTVTPKKIAAMQTLGVPYPNGYDQFAVKDYKTQAKQFTESLNTSGIQVDENKEIVALIAYLQRLGTDIKMDRTARTSD